MDGQPWSDRSAMVSDQRAISVARTLEARGARDVGMTVRPDDSLPAPSSRVGRVGPSTLAPRELPPMRLAESGNGAVDFELRGLLGEGGMGVVELARQRSLSRDVAVKSLRAGFGDHAVRGLLAEASFTGYLEHPSIVPVHAIGRDEERGPILVMKRVEGVTLGELLAEPDHLGWEAARGDRLGWLVRCLLELTHALELAHSRGVLHRDIKPGNVMVGNFGEVYLLDWGVAIRTADAGSLPAGAVAGTPSFMAPEMVCPETGEIDERTDVYLLGATLHSLLTGGGPRHRGVRLPAVLLAAIQSAPFEYSDDVPAELGAIANRATDADADARFPSVAALRDALENWLEHRASIELADVSLDKLEDLRALVAREDGVLEARPLFYACRFGLEQALRGWPENDTARRALTELLEVMCRFELRTRNLPAARALAAEMNPVPPDVEAALTALQAELAANAEKRRSFERIQHEHDPVVSRRQRRLALRALGALGLVVATTLITVEFLGIPLPPPTVMVVAVIPLLVVTLTIVLRFRHVFLATRLNRLIAMTVVVASASLIVHRVLGAIRGDEVRRIVSGDAFMLAVVFALGAVSIRRAFLVPSAAFLIGALVGSVEPALAIVSAAGAGAISVLFLFAAGDRWLEPLVGGVFDRRKKGADDP